MLPKCPNDPACMRKLGFYQSFVVSVHVHMPCPYGQEPDSIAPSGLDVTAE